jgi:hypothetical protein
MQKNPLLSGLQSLLKELASLSGCNTWEEFLAAEAKTAGTPTPLTILSRVRQSSGGKPKAGTGYAEDDGMYWDGGSDYNQAMKDSSTQKQQEAITEKLTKHVHKLHSSLSEILHDTTESNADALVGTLKSSCLLPFLEQYIRGVSFLELEMSPTRRKALQSVLELCSLFTECGLKCISGLLLEKAGVGGSIFNVVTQLRNQAAFAVGDGKATGKGKSKKNDKSSGKNKQKTKSKSTHSSSSASPAHSATETTASSPDSFRLLCQQLIGLHKGMKGIAKGHKSKSKSLSSSSAGSAKLPSGPYLSLSRQVSATEPVPEGKEGQELNENVSKALRLLMLMLGKLSLPDQQKPDASTRAETSTPPEGGDILEGLYSSSSLLQAVNKIKKVISARGIERTCLGEAFPVKEDKKEGKDQAALIALHQQLLSGHRFRMLKELPQVSRSFCERGKDNF